jgi:hypothetical protein
MVFNFANEEFPISYEFRKLVTKLGFYEQHVTTFFGRDGHTKE